MAAGGGLVQESSAALCGRRWGPLSAAGALESIEMERRGVMGLIGTALRVAALLALLQLAAGEESGRWRYGSISWKRSDPSDLASTSVVFTVER